jgi:alginate O-acetyltransferase complex protein AlgI
VTILTNPWMILVLLATFCAHWLLRSDRLRLALLASVSLALLGSLHPLFVAIMLAVTTLVHLTDRGPDDESEAGGGRRVAITVCAALLLFAVARYGQAAVQALFGGDNWVVRAIVAPLGVSYFIFRVIQYVLDRRRGLIEAPAPWLHLLLFFCFFPTLPAGPIETYQALFARRSLVFPRELVVAGARRILIGYWKKLFLVDLLLTYLFGDFMKSVTAGTLAHLSQGQCLGFVALAFIRAYLDLSGYSDIAVGLSALFGFRVLENFDAPLLRTNLGDFWRSWHVSLSNWCRNNAYLYVLGLTRRPWLGLYASMLTIGLWHELSLNWLTWSLYHGSGLVVASLWNRRSRRHPRLGAFMARRPVRVASWAATMAFVALGYAFVSIPDSSRAWRVFLGSLGA